MSPDHLSLAMTELQGSQQEGLIEPTSSPWACQAFYVNKQSDQIRETLRLVIDYRPLNRFLRDD